MTMNSVAQTSSTGVRFWTPPMGRVLRVGPEQRSVALPDCPLPLNASDLLEGEPSDAAIGQGVYDYLRRFPDCVNGPALAALLRDAYPHFLADLASQIVMLDEKEVDAPYVRRKIVGLKVLALLEPDNPALWQHLGLASFELGLMFSELPDCRRHLLAAMGFLQRSLELRADNPAVQHHLVLINFWLGDYPVAQRALQELLLALDAGDVRRQVELFLDRFNRGELPEHPVMDDLEAVGRALTLIGNDEHAAALALLESVDESGILNSELPMPEFFHVLGLCRERVGDLAGAFDAYEQALALDVDFMPALAGRERILDGGRAE